MNSTAVRFALVAALALAAAGCSRSRSVDDNAAPASETVSDVAASSEAPAVSDAASDAKAVVKDASDAPARAQGAQDLDPDEVAAAGDTRRHPDRPPVDQQQQ